MWTKRQLIRQAFVKAGFAAKLGALNADQYIQALSDLDAMMASWNSIGIRIGYALGGSDPDDQSGIPDEANAAVYHNLALLICPNFGKEPPRMVVLAASTEYKALLSKSMAQSIPEKQMQNTLPVGSGNRSYTCRKYFPSPSPTLDSGADGQITFD